MEALNENHNISLPKNYEKETFNSVFEMLESADKKLLILVDEMDKLYEINPDILEITQMLPAKEPTENKAKLAAFFFGSTPREIVRVMDAGRFERSMVELQQEPIGRRSWMLPIRKTCLFSSLF